MAGRAKKKCLFEDDVRAMLGMPKIDFQDEDTTLEKKLANGHAMQMRGSDDDDDDEGWRAWLCRGKNGVCLVLVLMCAAAAVVLGMELRQASQAADRVGGVTKVSVTYVGGRGRGEYHPRRGRAVRGSGEIGERKRAQGGHEAEVVTRHNWKALQDKADRERIERKGDSDTHVGGQREEMKEEDAFRRSGGARGSVKAHQAELSRRERGQSPPTPSSTSDAIRTFDKVLLAAAKEDRNSGEGGWSEKNGGPHSGARY